jgi:hypothetical protein
MEAVSELPYAGFDRKKAYKPGRQMDSKRGENRRIESSKRRFPIDIFVFFKQRIE